MLSLDEARVLAQKSVGAADVVELPLLAAQGRYLAESVQAGRSLPGCDNSAMDGYAVKSADTRGANRDRPACFRLVETVFAGRLSSHSVGQGEAVRIFTGAPIPQGADCVVRQEATARSGDEVKVFVEESLGSNIRRRGEEMEEGQQVLVAGQRLDAFALGVLASLGRSSIRAWPPPKVAVLTTGDELISPGRPALPHQTYDSNGTLLAGLSAEAGATVKSVEREIDRDQSVRAALSRLIGQVDLLVTSGGASVGDKDLVKRCLNTMGARWIIDTVALKPGKHVALAVVEGHPVAVLPGNPGAASVAFDQIVRPILLKRQGVIEERQRLVVRLDSARHKQAGLTYLLSAKLERLEHGEPIARVRPQGAGQIFQNVGSDGWVILPKGKADFASGETVTMELFASPSYLVAAQNE